MIKILRRYIASKQCRLVILISMSIMCVAFMRRFLSIKRRTCSNSEGNRDIAELCHLYYSGQIVGNLCPDLCDMKSLRLQSCLYGGASKSVMHASWQGTPIVLKSRPRDPDDLKPLTVWEITEGNKEKLPMEPDVDSFELMVHGEITSLLSSKDTEDIRTLVGKLSDGIYDPDVTKPTLAFMNTIMTLAQQEEYVNFKYFRDTVPFPDVHGYCGHFYGVEYLAPDRMLSSISLWSYGSRLRWKDRVQIALNLIDIVRMMDNHFNEDEEKLHMCDVKAENFGVGADLSVKVIDGDMIFTSAKMRSILEAEKCSVDDDCDFFDCEGVCDVTNKRCTTMRRNTNFQVLCRDIFSTGLRGTQLLRSPPEFADFIRDEVERCSRFTRNERAKQGWDPSLKLRELLKYSCRNL